MTLLQAKKRSKLYLASTGLYTIPQDWFSEKLGAIIADLQFGFASGLRDDQGIVQLRMNNISNDGRLIFEELLKVPVPSDIENFRLQKDDIIFNNTNSLDLIGKTAIVEELIDYTFSNHLTRIRVDINILLPYWIYLILLRYKERAVFRSICNTHVGQSSIGKKELRNLEIFFPPIREQQKISSILSKVDELIQKADQAIEQTQRLKKGLMQRLLTKGIGHTEFKKECFALRSIRRELPISWKVVKLSKLSKVVRGHSPRPAGDPKYFDGKVPWITVSELTKDDDIFLNSVTFGLTKLGKEKSRFLDKGTVVVANSGATLGKPKILNVSGCINDGVAAFLSLDKNLIPEFLYYVLFSWIKILRSINQGVYQLNINTEIIGNLLLPLPSIEEQRSIVSIMLSIDSKIQEIANYRSNLDVLKKGLMQKLLTGKIRVKV